MRATVKVTGQTGVEMEALTAVSVACLTIYDMVKAVERGMRIDGIRLVEKRGGKSGTLSARRSADMALLPVADALAQCSTASSRCRLEQVPLDDADGRVLAADLAALRTQPPAGRLGHGRLCGARRRCRERAGAPAGDRRGRGRPAVRRRGRRRRSGAHLHRRRAAARRRHHRDPGEHRARRRHRRRHEAGAARPATSAAPASTSAPATCCCRRAAASPAATWRSPPR